MANPIKAALKQAYFSPRLNKQALRLYSVVRPPPHRREHMEFDLDVWNGICTFRSTAGRPIGENNTSPEMHKVVVETEHKICKFEGSRYGLPINVTALREVMTVWDDALQLTTLLRQRFMARHGLTDARFNLRQGYVFSKAGAAIPAFLARRAQAPIADGTLAPLETAFFTLGVGPFMVVRALMERGDLRAAGTEPHSAEVLYELADTSGSIVSAGGKGCAGSKKLFLDFLDVAMNGTYAKPLQSAEAQRVMASLGDGRDFFDYLYASSRLELLLKVTQALFAQHLFALRAHAHELGADERAALGDSLGHVYQRPLPDLDDRTVLQNFLSVTLDLLDELGLPALRGRLQEATLLGADVTGAALAAGDARRVTADRLRQIIALLGPLCETEQAGIARALGRPAGAVRSADDLVRRCGGRALPGLLAALARPSTLPAELRHPVAAAAPFLAHRPDGGDIALRPLDLALDLTDLHAWVNSDHARFWGQQGKTLAQVGEIYRSAQALAAGPLLIGTRVATGEKICLLECYDPRIDGLARHYAAQPGDRGLHLLVAPALRPVSNLTYDVLHAAAQFLFQDPAVRRIVAEPDLRNAKVLARFQQAGYDFGPVIRLPHKTARMTWLTREAFGRLPATVPPRVDPARFQGLPLRLHLLGDRVLRRLG